MLLLILALGGCYWSRYPQVMETHLVLLTFYGEKLVALARDGEVVPPQDWGEFTYPLERAQDFARIAAKRFPRAASLARFRVVLERYGELAADPHVLQQPHAAAHLERRLEALRKAVAATRAALAREAKRNDSRRAA